jgi:hypothetical protein
MAPQPAPAIAVRQATAADAPAIAELAAELGYHVGVDDVRRRLAALPAAHVVLVATDRERVVGWLHAFHGLSVLHGERVEIARPGRRGRSPSRSHPAEDWSRARRSQRRWLLRLVAALPAYDGGASQGITRQAEEAEPEGAALRPQGVKSITVLTSSGRRCIASAHSPRPTRRLMRPSSQAWSALTSATAAAS